MHKLKGRFSNWLWLALSGLVLVADQLSKYWALATLVPHHPYPVCPLFNLTLAYNPGAAFSFLRDADGWQRWFFSVIAIGMSLLLMTWLYTLPPRRKCLAVALALIIGGALGNLWDRVAYGYVIDFIDIYWQQWHWPTFNIADTAVCVGAALLLLDMRNA